MRQIEIFGIILITEIFALWKEPESPALTSVCSRARPGRVSGGDFQDLFASYSRIFGTQQVLQQGRQKKKTPLSAATDALV